MTISMKHSLTLLLNSYGHQLVTFDANRKGPISDITHSVMYIALRKRLKMLPDDITLLAHPDGAVLHKGKGARRTTAFFVHFTVNELPLSTRQRHVLLHTVHCDSETPERETILTPLIEELEDLMVNGLTWMKKGLPKFSRVFLIVCASDSAERYKLLNMTSYGGYYACTTCEIKGVYHVNKVVYPFSDNIKFRTHNEMIEMALRASIFDDSDQKKMVDQLKGIRGTSVFSVMSIDTLHLPRSFPSDFLHLFCEGIMKRLL